MARQRGNKVEIVHVDSEEDPMYEVERIVEFIYLDRPKLYPTPWCNYDSFMERYEKL